MSDQSDRKFMGRALQLARRGVGLSSPNPSVGCVVVRAGRIVGEGLHEYALLDHAEVRALSEAGGKARGSTVYLTLEPCSHQGRTPPCADLLIKAGVRRVVAATIDPNPRVSGAGIDVLRSAGIPVEVGLMREEALPLIEPFACSVTTGLPLVVSKVGMSLDGRIATRRRENRWITSPEAREFGQSLRLQLDALLVGIGTVLADDPELTYRGSQPKARPLTRVVLDGRLRTPATARMLRSASRSPALIFCGRGAPAGRRRALEKTGAEVMPVRETKGGLDLKSVLHELARRRVLGVLVEGGAEVHWSFFSAGLVDKFYCVVAPLVLGGRGAVPSVGGEGYGKIREALRFRIGQSFYAGTDLVLETYPSGSRSILSPWLSRAVPPCGAPGPERTSGPR